MTPNEQVAHCASLAMSAIEGALARPKWDAAASWRKAMEATERIHRANDFAAACHTGMAILELGRIGITPRDAIARYEQATGVRVTRECYRTEAAP